MLVTIITSPCNSTLNCYSFQIHNKSIEKENYDEFREVHDFEHVHND